MPRRHPGEHHSGLVFLKSRVQLLPSICARQRDIARGLHEVVCRTGSFTPRSLRPVVACRSRSRRRRSRLRRQERRSAAVTATGRLDPNVLELALSTARCAQQIASCREPASADVDRLLAPVHHAAALGHRHRDGARSFRGAGRPRPGQRRQPDGSLLERARQPGVQPRPLPHGRDLRRQQRLLAAAAGAGGGRQSIAPSSARS